MKKSIHSIPKLDHKERERRAKKGKRQEGKKEEEEGEWGGC